MANNGRPAKWRALLEDDEVRRWYEQLGLGSNATAEERIRVLGRFCETIRMSPKELADLGRDANGGRRKIEDTLMDFVGKMSRKGKSPGYTANMVKVVKSWLLFNEVALVRRIRVGDATATPTLEAERIPTKAELHGALSVADERGKYVAFAQRRPDGNTQSLLAAPQEDAADDFAAAIKAGEFIIEHAGQEHPAEGGNVVVA